MAPSITPRGKASLDQWLDETTASGVTPALFCGVASQDEILYFNCQGEKVLGEPHMGQVDEDTSEPPPLPSLCRALNAAQRSNYGR